MRLEDVGALFGFTRERARQIEAKALTRRTIRQFAEALGVSAFTHAPGMPTGDADPHERAE